MTANLSCYKSDTPDFVVWSSCETDARDGHETWSPVWDSAPALWENRGGRLKVDALQVACEKVLQFRHDWGKLPVTATEYDGTGERRVMNVAEVGLTGTGRQPSAVVITVVAEQVAAPLTL